MLRNSVIACFVLKVLCVAAMSQESPGTGANAGGGSGTATETEPSEPDDTANPAKLFEPREYADGSGEVLQYRLLKPLEYDPAKKYPLVIFLHGAGERGDDNTAQLKHCLKEFCTPERRENYRCYVLAPQCPEEQKWADIDWTKDDAVFPESISRSLRLTLEVVDSMLEDAAIDKSRIYVCGLSMGGFGTWDAVARRPNFFAAAIPLCGGGNSATVADFVGLPVWCFHGDQDKSVDVEKSRRMIAALKAAGGQPKYTEYAGVGHDSWTATFANEQVLQWLFSQRRSAEAPESSN